MSQRARGRLLAMSALLIVIGSTIPSAYAFPAFARKYGVRCTGCHEAWPVLNDFGRAFRDNGYQMLLGKDEPTTTHPAYIPISIRLTPHYEFDSVSGQPTDQGTKTLSTGGVADIGMDLLTGGTLAQDISFLVVPTGFTSGDGVTLESAWVRFDNLLKSSWLNLKVGKHEVDLPRSAHRPWNLTSTGYLIYGYHPPGSASAYDMGQNQRGIEYVGHDRGSMNRLAVSVFTVEGTSGSRGAIDTPGIYLHATHEWLFDSYALSEAKVGVFGASTTWPTTSYTSDGTPIPGTGSDLKRSSRYGLEGHLWFGPNVTPLHMIVVYARGQDDKALIPDATRNGTFSGGYLELGYTPTLKTTIFGRYDAVRNEHQAVPDVEKKLNDQDAQTVGVRHTFSYSNRAEYALHAEYSTMRTKLGASDGSDLRVRTVFLGIDFAY
jgi:hypothetical protein